MANGDWAALKTGLCLTCEWKKDVTKAQFAVPTVAAGYCLSALDPFLFAAIIRVLSFGIKDR
jgi:hypothetical protein